MRLILISGFLMSWLIINAQALKPAFVSDSLDNYIEQALEDWMIPGAAVLVVKDGQVVIQKGYGVIENGKTDKVDENTLFMIASNTKGASRPQNMGRVPIFPRCLLRPCQQTRRGCRFPPCRKFHFAPALTGDINETR